jgi:hypothetical protein
MEMLRSRYVGMAEDLRRDHRGTRPRDHEAMAMLAQLLLRTRRIEEARNGDCFESPNTLIFTFPRPTHSSARGRKYSVLNQD